MTALQPAPRGAAQAASTGAAGVAGEAAVLRRGAFFSRAAELDFLATLLAGPPASVLVVTGPSSCGKSGALRRSFVQQRAAALEAVWVTLLNDFDKLDKSGLSS